MMELTALETRRALDAAEPSRCAALLQEWQQRAEPQRRRETSSRQIRNEARVEGDPFLLRRAVSNLLDNAIDFSPSGAECVALPAMGR